MKIILIISLFIIIPFTSIFSQLDERLKGIDIELEKALKSLDETGFAVAIVEKDKIYIQKALGIEIIKIN